MTDESVGVAKLLGASRVRLGAEGLYLAVVGCLAVIGGVRGTAAPYLVAIVLTLPFGLPATVFIYAGYALLKGVGGLFAPAVGADGGDAAWLSTGSATLNVVLLVGAAAANVLLLEYVLRRHHRTACS